ncbi:MAG TPA: sigma-70 family RNA polymerase sigma factor [Pseudonocardia sp.]|nr:sigma-70 family RNA polymerase sigma factor [Pseudonocardia sp.]
MRTSAGDPVPPRRTHPMMDDAALTELALRARAGDESAATQFVRHTQQQVWRMLVALSDRGAAEDLTQETYARAFRSLPGFRAESSVRAWLLSIARRVAADHVRGIRARPRIDPDVTPEDAPNAVADGDHSEAVALHAVLDTLDPDRRLAFLLTQLLGLSYHEAAQVCDCPVGTIRSRVARARDDLVARLADRDHPDARSHRDSG